MSDASSIASLREKREAEENARAAARERAALAVVREHAAILAHASSYIWSWGDGYGGAVRQYIEEAFDAAHLPRPSELLRRTPKATIAPSLRKAVFERDEYRCRHCGTCKDLTIDHVHPESRGGETTLENLQTLCRPCNSRKHDRVA